MRAGENPPEVASELPPAYVPPGYIAPVSALDQPAVGLVIAAAALVGLPQAAGMFLQGMMLDSSSQRSSMILPLMMLTAALVQLAAGIAIGWQRGLRRVAFFAYLACNCALVLCLLAPFAPHMSAREIGVLAIPILGGPLVILIAPQLFGVTRIARGHALGGLLLVSALGFFAYQPVSAFGDALRYFDEGASSGRWVSLGARTVIVLATSVLMLVAGLRMARGLPARRWLTAYVIVALVGRAGLEVMTLATFELGRQSDFAHYFIVDSVVTLIIGFAKPLLAWHFANQEEPVQGRPMRIDAALPWLALWCVAPLAARCLQSGETHAQLGDLERLIIVSCAVEAVLCLLAARAALRGERSFGPWCAGAAVASLMAAVAGYFVFVTHDREVWEVSELAWRVFLLLATMVTGAWLARRADHSRRGGDGQP